MEYLNCIKSSQGHVFTSINAAKAKLQELFPQSEIQLQAAASDAEVSAPRYLFRGESGAWSSSLSSMQRIRDGIDPLTRSRSKEETKALYAEVEGLALLAGQYIKESKGWDPMTAAGFLQHYEMPTEFLDFTASLQTALGFALWNVTHKNIDPMVVYLCVAETKVLSSNAVLPDFAALARGTRRPRIQKGYGVFGRHCDLKSPEAIKSYGLRWFAIHVTFPDLATDALDPALLDLAPDETAGFLKWVLDMAVKDRGYLTDTTAAYLADRVAAVLPIKKSLGNGRVEYISHSSAGRALNIRAQKAQNYNDWRRSNNPKT
jgi:hypothetical protein